MADKSSDVGTTLALPVLSCDSCGVCCTFIRTPPHRVTWKDDQPNPLRAGHPDPDYRMLMAAPAEARQLIADKLREDSSTSDVCAWLNLESMQCRFYDFRPQGCRNFEMGGTWCQLLRKTML